MENNPLRINFLSGRHGFTKTERFPDSSIIGLEPYEIDIIYRYVFADDLIESTNKVVDECIPYIITSKGKEKLQELSKIASSLQKVPIYGLYFINKQIHIINIILMDDKDVIGNINQQTILNTERKYIQKIFFQNEYQDMLNRISLFKELEERTLTAQEKEISKLIEENKKEIKFLLKTLLIQK